MTGYVRVTNNSGEQYDNAQTRLVVGKINLVEKIAELARRPPPGIGTRSGTTRPGRGYGGRGGGKARVLDEAIMDGEKAAKEGKGIQLQEDAPKKVVKQGLSEYFLFTIEGREDIKDKEPKRLVALKVADVPLECIYKLADRDGGQGFTKFYRFKNIKLLDEQGRRDVADGSGRAGKKRREPRADQDRRFKAQEAPGGRPSAATPTRAEIMTRFGPKFLSARRHQPGRACMARTQTSLNSEAGLDRMGRKWTCRAVAKGAGCVERPGIEKRWADGSFHAPRVVRMANRGDGIAFPCARRCAPLRAQALDGLPWAGPNSAHTRQITQSRSPRAASHTSRSRPAYRRRARLSAPPTRRPPSLAAGDLLPLVTLILLTPAVRKPKDLAVGQCLPKDLPSTNRCVPNR